MGSVTLNYTFDSNLQGWGSNQTTYNPDFTVGWSSSAGNPAGSLGNICVNPTPNSQSSAAFQIISTYFNLGVPSGATVTSVSMSAQYQGGIAGGYNGITGFMTGNLNFFNSYSSSANTAWTDVSGTVSGLNASSSSSVLFEIDTIVTCDPSGNAANFYVDNVTIVINYTAGPITGTLPVNLFIQGASSLNTGVDLYTSGSTAITGSVDMAIGGMQQTNSDTCTCAGLEAMADTTTFDSYCSCSNTPGSTPLFILGGSSVDHTGCVCDFSHTFDGFAFDSFCVCSLTQSVNMYINGVSAININNSIDAYIKGSAFSNANTPLYARGIAASSVSTTLYLNARTSANSSLPMIIGGDWDTVPNSGIGLYIGGVPYSYEVGSRSLVINGSSGINIVNKIPLFVHGDVPDTGSNRLTLYINGPATSTASTPLFVKALVTTTQSAPLFINSNINTGHTSYLPLYLDAVPRHSQFRGVRMSVLGGSGNDVFSNTPLWVNGIAHGTSFDLFIKGKDTGGGILSGGPGGTVVVSNPGNPGNPGGGLTNDNSGTAELFNLWINGVADNNTFPLYLANGQSEVSDYSWLYISGYGYNVNNPTQTGNLGLYIERGPNGGMTLYLHNTQNNDNQPLFVHGIGTSTNTANLFTQGFIASGSPTLFVVGGVPQGLNNNFNMSIPSTFEVDKAERILYVHGFNSTF